MTDKHIEKRSEEQIRMTLDLLLQTAIDFVEISWLPEFPAVEGYQFWETTGQKLQYLRLKLTEIDSSFLVDMILFCAQALTIEFDTDRAIDISNANRNVNRLTKSYIHKSDD